MSPERSLLDMHEGDWLAAIIAGGPPFERDTGYEPSLLPHLARLCHDFSIDPLLEAAALFGKNRSHPLAWPQLWESTLRTLVGRFDDRAFVEQSVTAASRVEVETYRLLVTGQGDLSTVQLAIVKDAGRNEPSLLARVLAAEPSPTSLERLRAGDPADLDAEGVRCLLVAAERLGLPLEVEWIERALGLDRPWIEIGRAAHVLPTLPDTDMREALTARLAQQIAEENPPAWFSALVVSRIARYAAHSVWNFDRLLDAPRPWLGRIKSLFGAMPTKSLAADVLRAHAFSEDLAAIERPHETTEPAPFEMREAWGGAGPPIAAPPPLDGGGRDFELAAPVDRGPAPPEPPARDERRLGVDAFVDGKRVERALIAGRKTEIEVSIDVPDAVQVQLPTPIDLDFGDVDRLSLPVRLVYGDTEQQATMRVLRDPTTRASVTFEVTPTADAHFNALIVVYDEDASTVIEAAAYSAAVVASEQDEQASEPTIQLVRVPVAGIGGPAGEPAGSVVTDGERAAVAAPLTPLRVTTDGAVQGFSPVMDLFRTAAQNFVAAGDTGSVTKALIMAARNGSLQRERLGLDELRPLERIQVVSFYATSILPLELIYDGAPPDAAATLCAGWQTALSTGACPTCDDPADTAHVCPLRFWGLTKTIEHHVGSETGSPDFGARESLRANVRRVSAPTSTVIGASNKVLQALASPPADPVDVLDEVVTRAAGLGPFDVVGSWDAWRDAIGNRMPNLLIAMPHQDKLHNFPALELGGELESVLKEGHVRKHGETPGPIVLLLGCDTSTAEDLIGSFASDFRRHAPVVIATIGKVVAQEAPRVASVIIDCLARVAGQPDATIGTALVEARRALLAESRVVGLLLVGHGDGRWEVQP